MTTVSKTRWKKFQEVTKLKIERVMVEIEAESGWSIVACGNGQLDEMDGHFSVN